MKKLPTPKVPSFIKVSKRTVLIALGVLVGLAVFSVAAAYQVRQEKVDNEKAAASVAAQKAHEADVQKQIAGLKNQNAVLQADKTAACSYLKTIATGKATRTLVTVPTAVHCQ